MQSDWVYIMCLFLNYRQCECEYFVAGGTERAAKLWCQYSHHEAWYKKNFEAEHGNLKVTKGLTKGKFCHEMSLLYVSLC